MVTLIKEDDWPPAAAFEEPPAASSADGPARCTSLAVCDKHGRPTRTFREGDAAHVFYEFEVTGEIGVPGGGLELRDEQDRLIHGRNAFQFGIPKPEPPSPGTRLRYHQIVELHVTPGTYRFDLALHSTDRASYEVYRMGCAGYDQFRGFLEEACRIPDAGVLEVRAAPSHDRTHDGLVDLAGTCRVTRLTPEDAIQSSDKHPDPPADGWPTICHVTHYKAGSQWIHGVLRKCVPPERLVVPQPLKLHFLQEPVQPGRVYPTLYVTKQEFDRVTLPENTRRFVVIRDLRDTLVSGYFSLTASHPAVDPSVVALREELEALSFEDGLVRLMDGWLQASAKIQLSWLEAGEPLIRYADLLSRDLEILERVLLDHCGLPVPRERFRQAVLNTRFERATRGRRPGDEDRAKHMRKGIAGDWQNHFSERTKRAFKARYGGLLVATGYERDLNW